MKVTLRPDDEVLDDIERRVIDGEELIAIADSLDVTARTVRNWFHRANRRLPKQVLQSRLSAHLDDVDWLREHRIDQRLTLTEIATITKTTTEQVRIALDDHELDSSPRFSGVTADQVGAALEDGESQRSLARRLGVHPSVVARVATQAGLRFPHPTDVRPPVLDDPDWLAVQVIDRRRTDPDIAAELHVGAHVVKRARQRHRVGSVQLQKVLDSTENRQRLSRMYVEEEKSLREIAVVFGVSLNTVLRAKQRHGLVRSAPKPITKAQLKEFYVRRGLSVASAAAEMRRPPVEVRKALDRHGIARHRVAPRGEAWLQRPGWLAGRIAQGATSQMIADQLGVDRRIVRSARWKLRRTSTGSLIPETHR